MKIDWRLAIPILILLALSLTIIKSVAPGVFVSQLVFGLVSLLFFVIFARIDYTIFFSLFVPQYVASLFFLILPYFFGAISRGAVRWLQIGTFSLQPSEIIKPFLIITFCSIAVSNVKNKLFWLILSFLPPALLIFLQPDLGTTLVILVGWVAIVVTKLSFKDILAIGVVLALLVWPIYRFALHDYQRQRLITFVNPYTDPLGRGYHVIQSTIAVGSGQLFGRGLGHGSQSQLQFLPEHHTDFVFAAISEELGLVGGSFIILVIFFLLFRIYQISQRATDPAAALFCLSTLVILFFQSFINIGMNIGIAPVTGVTLPFVSYGGSSLLSLGITLGLVSSIAN
ncbi:MAG: FtsW/RodA/SpoVE family cell cycle protein, partial [Patescibacteria group bacterium]